MIGTEIHIKLIGGPRDGVVGKLRKPDPILRLTSKVWPDIFHVYQFDEDPTNHEFPLIYRFRGYEEKNRLE